VAERWTDDLKVLASNLLGVSFNIIFIIIEVVIIEVELVYVPPQLFLALMA